MPRVDSSSEAPSHLRKSVSFLPSLAEIIVGLDVLIHFLKQLLQSLRGFPSEVLSCTPCRRPLIMASMTISLGRRRLCSQAQEPSDICLKVLLMVLSALEQGLSSDWLRLL
jgi:hypothetical protein